MSEALSVFFHVILDVAFLFQSICISFATALVLHPVRTKSWKAFFQWLLFWLISFALVFVFELGFFLLGSQVHYSLGLFFSLGYLAAIMTFAALCSKTPWKERIIEAMLLFATIAIILEVGVLFGQFFYKYDGNFDIGITKSISYVFVVFLGFLLYFFPLRGFEINRFDLGLNLAGSILSSAALLIFEGVSPLFLDRDFSYDARLYLSIIFFILYLINIVIYFMTYFLAQSQQQVLDLRAQEQKRASDSELLSLSESNLREMREIRHDIKNQYAYLKGLLAENKTEEAEAFLEQIGGKFSPHLFNKIDCGNEAINAIMELENSKYLSSGVKLKTNLVVPHTLKIDDVDLCSLLGNLLDNALEECLRCQAKEPVVECTLSYDSEKCYLFISNPTTLKNRPDSLVSSKKEPGHGYGLAIVEKLVNQYDGYFHYSVEKGRFLAEAVLSLPEES
jgi:signal transduction histidine kinase